MDLVWIGIRESDIKDSDLFKGSITIFGSNKDGNISMDGEYGVRYNHNTDLSFYCPFVSSAMVKFLNKNPDTKFVCYDNVDIYDVLKLYPEFKGTILYANPEEMYQFLNNKHDCREYFKDCASILSYDLVDSQDLGKIYPLGYDSVLQLSESYGGNGTYFVPVNSDLSVDIKDNIKCSISQYIADSVSINYHAVVSSKNYVIYPGSIQIIDKQSGNFNYFGADFSAFRQLSKEQKSLSFETVKNICKKLMSMGYKGVLGVDLLLTKDECYFMEINSRFQSSSFYLNKMLKKLGLPDLYYTHCLSFDSLGFIALCNKIKLPKEIDGSFYIYDYIESEKEKFDCLYLKFKASPDFEVLNDALNEDIKLTNGCYYYKIVSKEALGCVTNENTYRLHPNVSLFKLGIVENDNINMLNLKTGLLCRGVSIPDAVWYWLSVNCRVDYEEFEAVDIKILNVWVNSPCRDKWYNVSPFEIGLDLDNRLVLKYYGKTLVNCLLRGEDLNASLMTSNGHYYSEIGYLNPDRLRIFYRNGCEVRRLGGCKFCNLTGIVDDFILPEIYEVIDYYLKNSLFEHFLIGGGASSSEKDLEKIKAIVKYIRDNSDKKIYLMCLPITNIEILKELHSLGVTEVAFNIEIYDKEIRSLYMPNKSTYTLSQYREAIIKGVEVYGKECNVRSAFVVGLEPISRLLEGVEMVCKAGGSPMLSVFRPYLDCNLSWYMPLDESTLLLIYEEVKKLSEKYRVRMGPSCRYCQNNMLI